MSRNLRLELLPNDLSSRDLPFIEKYVYNTHGQEHRARNNAVRRALDPLMTNPNYDVRYFVIVEDDSFHKPNNPKQSTSEHFLISYKGVAVMDIWIRSWHGEHRGNQPIQFARCMQLFDNDVAHMKGVPLINDGQPLPQETIESFGFELRGLYNMLRPVIRDVASTCHNTCVGIFTTSDGNSAGDGEKLHYDFAFSKPDDLDYKGTLISFSLRNISGKKMEARPASEYGIVADIHVNRQVGLVAEQTQEGTTEAVA